MKLDPASVVSAYREGYFLMDNGEGLNWYSSRVHALFPLDGSLHIPRSLRRKLNSSLFESRINDDFLGVVRGCANRSETWITPELEQVYSALHRAGVAHSFETWYNGELAGGVLGLSIGAAFIGESMFTRVPECGKVALVRLVQHLQKQAFLLFDAQVQNPHLKRFGAFQVPEREFKKLLDRATHLERNFVP
ncbi:MAG: leucyl/phenylalanyl-tRNA--protein transferase [Deinococcales bacterium]